MKCCVDRLNPRESKVENSHKLCRRISYETVNQNYSFYLPRITALNYSIPMKPQQSFFFLYGTPKCGTTWLCENLGQSHQFYDGGKKEWRLWPFHFKSLTEKSEALDYLNHEISEQKTLLDLLKISPKTEESALGGVRTKLENMKKKRRLKRSDAFLSEAIRYCRDNSMIITLADMTPGTGLKLNLDQINQISHYFRRHEMNTKCIWLIRDPLSRAISALKMKLANQRFGLTSTGEVVAPNGTIPKSVGVLNDNNRLEEILRFSRYDRFWQKYISLEMPKEIFFYEDFFTQNQLSRITNFLDMDEVKIMPSVVNQGKEISIDSNLKATLAKSLEPTYDYMSELYGWKNLPPQWRESYLEIRH